MISNEEQLGSSSDQFDTYNKEIYQNLQLYLASKESDSSDSDDGINRPFKTEEDLTSNVESVSKLLKIIAAGSAE